MAHAQTSETTLLLRAWAEGDRAALEQLTPRVYAELRRIAGHCMQNERPGRTLQTTALVHEAYLRLIDVTNVNWEHRAHFFAVSAQIMRHILVDRATHRARRGAREPGGIRPAQGADHRATLLWRLERGRDCCRAEGLAGHRHAGLEAGKVVAVARVERAAIMAGRGAVSIS
jgi:DNA-directed RNA polymerase specialized sigma24 family protein